MSADESGSSSVPNRRRAVRRREDVRLIQRERELEAAQRTCQDLFQHHRIDELVEKVLRTAMDSVDAEAGSILLADRETERLVFQYVVGEGADVLRGTSFPWHEGIAGAVFQSGEPSVIADVKQDPRHFAGVDLLTGYKTRDMITVPLKKWEGHPIGVLNVLNKQGGKLGQEDLSHLIIISAVAAVAIQQARQFEEAKLAEVARLAADIGHDLKNLLQPLLLGTEIIKAELAEAIKSAPKDKAQVSERVGNEAYETVQLTVSRIHDRVKQIGDCVKGLTAPPKFAPCRVHSIVDAVFQALRVVATERGVQLLTNALEIVPDLIADEHRLFNAFYNLVNNAIPVVNPGGSVIVRGQPPQDGMVTITVEDTGKGMTPDVLQSLFSGRAISQKPGGTGLGTKIVKDVVTAHGGEISVESHLGAGTKFTLRLPLDPRR